MDELWNEPRAIEPRAEPWDEVDAHATAQLAEQRAEFTADLVKFAIWTGLALTFIFPLGVILLICGAPKRIRRFHALYLEPSTRDRPANAGRRRRRRRRSRARRSASEGRAAPKRVERPRREPLRLADVVEDALDELGPRLARSRIEVQRGFDTAGALTGDAAALRAAATELLSLTITGLERSGGTAPRLHVELGENLAGNAVWLRVRESATADEERTPAKLARVERVVSAHGGTLERVADGSGTETVVTLPKTT